MKHDMTPIMIKTQGHRSSVESRLQSGSNHHVRHLLRSTALVALLLTSVGMRAQNNYVFYNSTYGYIINNNGNPGVSTTFSKSAIWVANNTMGTSNRNVRSYTDATKYFTGSAGTSNSSNGTFSLGTSNDNWQLRGTNYLNRRNATRGYVRYNGTGFIVNSSNADQNFTGLAITINSSTTSNPTIGITASSGVTGGGIQLTGNITGTYTPSYSYATVRNYNNTNTQTYYWTATTEATTIKPDITDWSDATITWTVTTGGTYASVSTDGLVTITSAPTGNIVVRMNVSKGGYTGNTSITLTPTAVGENIVTTYSPISVSPSSVTLDGEGTQAVLAVSPTVTKSIVTTPVHTKITSTDGKTYYYLNDNLSTTVPSPSISSTTLNLNHVDWSANGGDGTYNFYTISPYSSDTSNEVTLTRTSTKNGADQSYTLTASAYYGDESYNPSATATVNIPITLVDIGDLLSDNLTLTYGESGALNAHASYVIGGTGAPYYDLTYTVADPTIASVDANGVVTALKVGTTTVTIQSKKMNGDPGPSCTVDITVNPAPLAAPSIAIDKDGHVTITDNNDPAVGATIYYTTNGDTPTASSTLYTTTFTAANLSTIKAIAIASSNYNPSAVVSEQFITSGVVGGTIILNDYEDHNWTYYSDKPDGDYPDNLRSPDPRNVVITYRGGSVANASAVAVSATEPENEYTYYKTIEKKAWGQSEGRWLTGDYAYRTIPNPFLKRPRTNGTTGTNGFWGFAGWKVVSGGEYISEYNNNATIPADALIHFVGLPAGNAGNGAVVLEAQWTQATVTTVNGNVTGNPNNAFTGGTSNTNFIVVSGNDRTVTGMTCDVTVMGCYPDGTGATGARLSTVTGSANDLVIENINLGTGGNDFTANTGWLVVGRGCTGNVRRVHGNTGQIRIRIESGLYNFINPMDGGAANNANYGRIIFGNDYDRATNDGLTSNDQYADNSSHRKLRVINYVSFNGSGAAKGSNTDQSEWMDITIKSGYYGFSADYSLYSTTAADNADGFGLGIGGNSDAYNDTYTVPDINGVGRSYTNLNAGVNNTSYRWQRLMSFYCGRTRGGNYGGVNRVLVEGGELNSINGGGYRNNQYNVNNLVTYHFRMKGGWVKGAIYGTASSSMTNATTKQVITGGEINGWVAGACNGTDVSNDDGRNEGDTYIYLGGTAELRSHRRDGVYNNAWGLVGGVEGGNIFASGRGTNATTAQPNRNYCGSSYRTYTVVADQAEVEQNVSGGGYIGVAQNSYIYITGGEIGKAEYGGSQTPTSTNNTWMTQTTDIRQYGGTVKGGIYGGHYQGTGDAGKIHQDVKISLVNGQVGTDMNNIGYVHGGGYGSGTSVGGNVDVTIGDATATESLVVYGDVYGGSALGTVGDAASDHTNVTLNAGTINGSLYGGGLGNASTAANVYGPVTVTVNGGSVLATSADGSGSVFGCNNLNGSPQRTVTVVVGGTDTPQAAGTFAVQNVFAGGNAAAYTGNPTVTVNGGYVGNVYGGGLGSTAALTGNSSVTLNGGTVGQAFGGGSQADVTGNVTVLMANQSPGAVVGEVYGGGALANTNTGGTSNTTTVNLFGGTVGNAYGGGLGRLAEGGLSAVAATVGGPVLVTLAGSKADNVFGCNNVNGTPLNSVKVLVQQTVAREGNHAYHVDNVYGGGNKAEYVPNNPNDFAATVEVEGCDNSIEYVYGGGNAASTPATDVTIWGGIIDYVFAGGNGQGADNPGANVGYHQDPDINDPLTPGAAYGTGIASAKIYGGEIHNVFGGSNTRGNIRESSVAELDVPDNKKCDTFNIGEVYGAGNMAYMAGSSSIELGCIPGLEVIYGGAKQANIGKDIVLTLTSGTFGKVFGGNNLGGEIMGSITVNIEETGCNPLIIGELYGCGNNASYTVRAGKSDPLVNIRSFTSIGKVFGGGLGSGAVVYGNTNVNINVAKGANADADASVVAEGTTVYGMPVPAHLKGAIGSIDLVFGGGNAAAVDGDTNVNIGTETTVEMESLPLVGGAKQTQTVEGVNITGNVYGGGNAADVTGKTNVTIGQP